MNCRLYRSALLLALAFPVACSGGGTSSPGGNNNGSGTPGTQDAHIVSNTAGGADGRLYGLVSAIALEDDKQQMTANLVSGNPELVLSDPVGASSGLELADFGPGRYVAVHLSFLPGSVKFKRADGSITDVVITTGSIKAPFTSVLDVKLSASWWLELRHNSKINLVKNPSGKLDWTPDMVSQTATSTLLADAEVEVVAVDQTAGTLSGLIRSLAGLRSKVQFLSDAILVFDDEEKTRADFLKGLQAGDVITVQGVLDRASVATVAFAEHSVDPSAGSGKGRKNKVRGRILSTDAATSTFTMDVTKIKIGGRGLPSTGRILLEVVSDIAKVKYVPRYGRHPGHLSGDALKAGMYVEVEWLGDAVNNQCTAHKVNIRSDGRLPFLSKLFGVVKSVDAVAGTMVIEHADQSDFVFGKERYKSLTIALDTQTILVAYHQGSTLEVPLSSAVAGQQVVLIGRKQAGSNVDALLVVIAL